VRFGSGAKTVLEIGFFIEPGNSTRENYFQGRLTASSQFICNGVQYVVIGSLKKLFGLQLADNTISFDCYGVTQTDARKHCDVNIIAYNIPLEIKGFTFPNFTKNWKTAAPHYDDSDDD
jgi:hypothetical protein